MRIIRRLLKLVLRIAIVLVLIIAVAYLYFSITWGRAVDRELSRLHKAGVRLSPAQFALPPVPDRENAALLYLAAAKKMQFTHDDWQVVGEALDPAILAKRSLRTFAPSFQPMLRRNQQTVSLVEEAARLSHCRFPVDPKPRPKQLPIPRSHWVSEVREVARTTGFCALGLAAQGDVVGAVRALQANLRLAEAVGSQPGMICQPVRLAIYLITLHELWTLEGAADLPPVEAHRLFLELRLDLTPDVVWALACERALTVSTFGEPSERLNELLDETGNLAPDAGKRFWIRLYNSFLGGPLRKHDELVYLKTMERAAPLAKLPYRRSKPGYDRLTRDAEHLPPWDLRTVLLPPASARMLEKRDQVQAEIGACRIGLALSIYRQRFHRYPATLSELEHAVGWPLPKDPFSGKDYSYRREGKGLVLSSWGPVLESEEAEWRSRLRERLTWRWGR